MNYVACSTYLYNVWKKSIIYQNVLLTKSPNRLFMTLIFVFRSDQNDNIMIK